jgi:hypothetical protein
MRHRNPAKGPLRKLFLSLKNGALVALLLLVPFAGAFHPKIRRREHRDEKEIGAKK